MTFRAGSSAALKAPSAADFQCKAAARRAFDVEAERVVNAWAADNAAALLEAEAEDTAGVVETLEAERKEAAAKLADIDARLNAARLRASVVRVLARKEVAS